jgi:hypothetical protein
MAEAAICEAATITARSSRIVLKVSSDSLPSPKTAHAPRPNIARSYSVLKWGDSAPEAARAMEALGW